MESIPEPLLQEVRISPYLMLVRINQYSCLPISLNVHDWHWSRDLRLDIGTRWPLAIGAQSQLIYKFT